jgi:hypothetical protein
VGYRIIQPLIQGKLVAVEVELVIMPAVEVDMVAPTAVEVNHFFII